MDRFIAEPSSAVIAAKANLKSNMDRFIAISQNKNAVDVKKFKIQYG